MRYLMFFLTLLAIPFMAGCATHIPKQANRDVPSADKLLTDAGLPNHFWYEDVTFGGKTPDGQKIWIVSGTEKPQRAEDGECAARDYTWTIAVNPEDGRGALNTYFDDPTAHNPEAGFMLNDNVSKRSIPCDQIDFKDYFLLGERIQPHQALDLIQALRDAVGCVKLGESQCGRWKKLDMESYKDDFLKLPELPVFMIEIEDRDNPDQITVKYVLYPPTAKNHEFTFLDCFVNTLSDGSLELEAAEGTPDMVEIK